MYITLGTIWNRDLDVFRMLVEALRDDVNVVVTLGRRHDPTALGSQPRGVLVRSYVPQNELLPWCAAVVAHGGSGTVLGTLAHGCPMLVLPQGADQWNNAQRVVDIGAGRQLLRAALSPAAVRTDVLALLADPSFRVSAEAVAAEIRDMPAPAAAIARVESLLEQGEGQ